ncbi:hypothetical protein LLT6_05110 [Lactococcus cremoris subsp. cremoris TIFN6]|uniref:Uncharacterized protein n=1 Tax=Lactococcus cremoris subsp. cremoris TIFN6 TaxID=1234876 RepID=T0SBF3_LACLC|nr:hypothetical protein LLT6_05110 [Lactococcus cremoris subsp. cremoris TIFN6]
MYIKKPKANYLGLSHEQWLKIRDILAIIMRHKPQPYQSNLIMSALNKIDDREQRNIFECYYFTPGSKIIWSISKFTPDRLGSFNQK